MSQRQVQQSVLKSRFEERFDCWQVDLYEARKKLTAINDMLFDDIGNPIVRVGKKEIDAMLAEMRLLASEVATLASLQEISDFAPSYSSTREPELPQLR